MWAATSLIRGNRHIQLPDIVWLGTAVMAFVVMLPFAHWIRLDRIARKSGRGQ
jgi:hypothetical protein